MKNLTFLFFVCLIPFFTFSQEEDVIKKKIEAIRIESSIKIDGSLDESAWSNAPVGTDFIESSPNPGNPDEYKTEFKIMYDNTNLYIGAVMYDVSKDSILRQLCLRDEIGQRFRGEPFTNSNTDWFGFVFDTYQDGVNALGFAVSAAGVQYDLKFSSQGQDRNWDAVWDAEVSIHDDKWVAEFAIPFSALRFSSEDIQKWNVNFARIIRRNRTSYWWNEIKPEVNGLLNQFGVLEGIENVKSPIRLQATPFIAGISSMYHDKNNDPVNQWGNQFTGGMDIKYGLTDAFTLDMTLIPNFGEAASDNQVLNLSPFEVRFDENRPFFTEGTELFNKGNIFYSRRIGGTPLNYGNVYNEANENESVVSNPIETPLYNAFKLSGRTATNLGIGVFNGIVGKTFATLENTLTGEEREVETNPLTNYNVLVFDQGLKNNSYVSLINTNTMRFGDDYDANVTATEFSVNNKSNSFNFRGSAKVSQLYEKGSDVGLGHAYNFSIGKNGGKFTYRFNYNVESNTYNPNDLGFLFNNNERSASVFLRYNQFEPFGKFNSAGGNIWMGYSMLYEPSVYNRFSINTNNFYVTKSFFAFGWWTETAPFPVHDYFESRQNDGNYLKVPAWFYTGAWISSDYRKKVAIDVNLLYGKPFDQGRREYEYEIEPRFRPNDKLFFVLGVLHNVEYDNVGFATFDSNSNSIIGKRNVNTVINSINGNYIFNNKMGITLRLRHYWSKVNYNSFFEIDNNGELYSSDYIGDHDVSFNAFTIDWIYRWRFAPGSDIVFVWKNSIFDSNTDDTQINYFENFKLFKEAPQTNTFTLKIVYFLDYYTLKSKWSKNKL